MLLASHIMLVRTSFARVLPIREAAADLFYDRLFEIAPQVRGLFPADLREQKRKLMAMLAMAVGGLNDLETVIPKVKTLGARHVAYGATAAHYEIVGEALLWTLERGLGEAFTPEVRSAWTNVYRVLATTMQAGAAEVGEMQAAV
jgi:hemoglobin-like flavoprotein